MWRRMLDHLTEELLGLFGRALDEFQIGPCPEGFGDVKVLVPQALAA